MGTMVCSNWLWPSQKVNERIAKLFFGQVNQIHPTFMKQFCCAREMFSPSRHVLLRGSNSHDPFDACLNNRPCTLHARNHRHHNPAVAQRDANPCCVVNCISFGMGEPKIFLRCLKPLRVFIVTPPGHSVVAEAVRTEVAAIENDCPHLGTRVFGKFSGQKACESQILGHFVAAKRMVHDSECAFKVR